MEKTTVYLTTDQKQALEQASRATGRSEAGLVREGIEAVTARHGAAETASPLVVGTRQNEDRQGDTRARRPRWISRDELVSILRPADAVLRAELRELAPDSTDDTPLR